MMYFDHSTSAASDSKIIALRLSQGGAAVDCFWVIAEQIYRDEKPLNLFGNPVGFSVITHLVSASVSEVKTWVNSMLDIGLLVRCEDDPDCVISERMANNIENYHAKCETARQNGSKGGRPKKTQSVSASVSKKKPTGLQQNKTKQNKSVGFHKENQTLTPNASRAVDGGDCVGETPYCASCGEVVIFKPDSMCFVCRNCGTLHAADEVVFR